MYLADRRVVGWTKTRAHTDPTRDYTGHGFWIQIAVSDLGRELIILKYPCVRHSDPRGPIPCLSSTGRLDRTFGLFSSTPKLRALN